MTTNTSSLPEVVGDAALTVNPYKPLEIAAALHRLDKDAELRAQLSEQGRVQAAKYSMGHYQTALSDMYSKVLAR